MKSCLFSILAMMAAPLVVAAEPAAPSFQAPPVPETFTHPGLLHSREEMDFVRGKIEAGEEPWAKAFANMKGSKWGALDYTPHPHETLRSGFYGKGGGPGGVYDANDDSIAAYTQALLWAYTGDERYAQNAVKILNAWSILRHSEGGNWYLQVAWTAPMFVNAAELIRDYPQWAPEDQDNFKEMLRVTYLPIFHKRMAYGNRGFSVFYAMMAIGVYMDDRAAFAEALAHWTRYVPQYFYMESDGPELPVADYWTVTPRDAELAALAANLYSDPATAWWTHPAENLGDDHTTLERGDRPRQWNNAPPEALRDGLCGETFRDLGHSDMAFGALINAAEIAWHQGIDLYTPYQDRLVAFMELQSQLRVGETLPEAFTTVKFTGISPTYEIAYNHYHNRRGVDLPWTWRFLQKTQRAALDKKPFAPPGWSKVEVDAGVRAQDMPYPAVLNMGWETLTHAGTGQAGAQPGR